MSYTPPSSHPVPKGNHSFQIWLLALIIFLIGLGWFIYSRSPIDPEPLANTSATPSAADSSFILKGLTDTDSRSTPVMPYDAAARYVLVGAGLQGFYQQNADNAAVWTISYPAPQLHAQLIRRGPESPQRITSGVTITWELDAQATMTDPAAQRSGMMTVAEDSWFTASIPVSALGVDGGLHPYPLITLRAKDEQGNTLAQSAAVLAVSPGFGCSNCHENDKTAILEVHDRHSGTDLVGLNAQGTAVDCRSCHTGLAAEPRNADKEKSTQSTGMSVSAAVHGWHAAYLSSDGAEACMSCHIALGSVSDKDKKDESEVKPLFARDFHGSMGLDCTRCHGVMEDHALALLKAEQKAEQAGKPTAASVSNAIDRAIAALTPQAVKLEEIAPRLPWTQVPDCTSCHDFTKHADLMTASAFNKWTASGEGTPDRFSVSSDYMSMIRCVSCHGAPHAVYPSQNPVGPDLDNIQPLQYQKQASALGAFGTCATCHGMDKEYSAHHPLVE